MDVCVCAWAGGCLGGCVSESVCLSVCVCGRVGGCVCD